MTTIESFTPYAEGESLDDLARERPVIFSHLEDAKTAAGDLGVARIAIQVPQGSIFSMAPEAVAVSWLPRSVEDTK